MDKDTKKKVEKVIDSILKQSQMTRKEFFEVKGVALEIKVSGNIEILSPMPIVVDGPTEEVKIVQACTYSVACSSCIVETIEERKGTSREES